MYGWEFRTVDIDIEKAIEKELIDQVGGIGGVDIENQGFSIDSLKAASFDFPLE